MLSAVIFNVHQLAVGNDHIWFFNRRAQFAGAKIVRAVVGRKPVAVKFGFALRPDLARFVRIVGVRFDKTETAPETADCRIAVRRVDVIRSVINLDGEFFAALYKCGRA